MGIKTNPNSGKDKAAATTSSMDAAAITAIIMSLVILLVIVAIFVYIRKYKRDFLNNQVIVRFRRPNAHHFSNEDSITVNDYNVDATNTTVVNDTVFEDNNNNNNNKTYSTHHFGDKELMSKDAYGREEAQAEEEEAIPEAKDGDNRFKNFVGGCKQKLKINIKKDDSMTTPLD